MMKKSNLIFKYRGASKALRQSIEQLAPAGVFVIADTTTCNLLPLSEYPMHIIGTGEDIKNLHTACRVWDAMEDAGVTRKWAMVCVGGGLVTDLGGFCAAAFKRGIPAINVPTTLLAAVDAAAGGKTAVNYHGLKNEIGFFAEPAAVVIDNSLFASLPGEQQRSGLAEMLKHALLDSPEHWHEVAQMVDVDPASKAFLPILKRSVAVKQRIVSLDPTEKGLRKALNFGHTIGHAIEEFCLEKNHPVPHGYAVAWGLVTEAVISSLAEGFPTDELSTLSAIVRNMYGPMPVGCNDYDRLLAFMAGDKKNDDRRAINFTLLKSPGQPLLNCTPPKDTILTALDIARDRLG